MPLTALAIKTWLSPAEVERRRVVDLLPNDLVVPPNEEGFLTSATPVLSRNTILDASPQVEVVLAGRNHPLIYACEGKVNTIQPIDLKPRSHSSEETEWSNRCLRLPRTWTTAGFVSLQMTNSGSLGDSALLRGSLYEAVKMVQSGNIIRQCGHS